MSSPAPRTGPVGAEPGPAPKPGLVCVPIDGETVVYDPGSDVLHRLDGPASAVWERLDGTETVHAIADHLAEGFGVPEKTARTDVAGLAETLRERGLLDGSPAPEPARPTTEEAPIREAGPTVLPLASAAAPYRVGRYRALEHTFEVATSDAAVRDYLAGVLTDLAMSDDGGGRPASRYEVVAHRARWIVRDGGEAVLATDWLDRALYALLWHINAETVRRSAPRYPVVHAAAATYGDVAVLLPAPPDAGKTTTVAGLVRAGLGYLSDEAVAIDPTSLRALPYPKALSVDRGSWKVLSDLRPPHDHQIDGQWQLPASSIRPGAVAAAAPVRFVLLPSYEPGAATRLEPAHRAEMLVCLADSTFHFQDAPRRNLTVLARVLEDAACYRLVLGDLDEAVRLVGELVRG
ncbi:MAG: PqqD family peptide modification chaperone [bacterium]